MTGFGRRFVSVALALGLVGMGDLAWVGVADDRLPPDVVVLASGGELAGKASEFKEGNRTFIVVELPNGSTVKLAKDQVKFVRRPKEAHVEYLQKKAQMADTVEAHWEMSEWCRDHLDARQANGPNDLGPERQFHLQAVIRLDPDHKQARAFLGYVNEKGEWINLEQKRLGHGFVRHDKRWLTPEEIALEQAEEAWKDSQTDWTRRLKKLRGGKPEQVLANLNQIADPAAIDPIVEQLNERGPLPWHEALVDVLGNIRADAATRALCDMAVNHTETSVRELAIARLKQEHIDKKLAAQYLARTYLTSKDNALINRTGFVLGELGNEAAVRPLIDALQTEHIEKNPNARNPSSITPTFSNEGMGIQQGGGGPPLLKITRKNEAVLDALRRLTNADYAFEETAWKDWFAEQHSLPDTQTQRDE